ncbi:tannase/feruloyl esterase family alpha/beta hydrolase [Rhodoferax sp.]|uniref:tannase/feruloyl esterase family alpha/beta hydrolase n=1 Tax=Rhodoferax sp. TaxID=50421 RepID=UPI00284C0F2E|nr:tannase/feruloyl esterase family alpha/beta hydrolase [Rhodoferax sp.]MDR3368347.1 tannase/feruloyl esterase family alpha/beta hydrolase [Rhodoferax sp.]
MPFKPLLFMLSSPFQFSSLCGNTRALQRTAMAAAATTFIVGCGGGSGGVVQTNLACEAITTSSLAIPGLKVASAINVAAKTDGATAGDNYPAHCQIQGSINDRTGIDGKPYAIGYEVRLPASWNGKFFFQGGGGTNGILVPALGNLLNSSESNALSQGYAVASTDGGHNTGQSDVNFGLDPQARSDYGYNAVGTLTVAAKQIIARRYGKSPDRSYFMGCSNGGRDAMVAASRFADQFDGLVAADPGFNLPKAAIAQQWDTQQFMSAASTGQLPKDAFPQSAMDAVAKGILAKCDALDGAVDGMVSNRSACQSAFNLATDVPTCTGAPDGTCITANQKTALLKIFAGPKNSQGDSLYATWPWDPGIAGANWRFWKLDAGFAPLPFNTLIGASAMGYIFTTPADAPSLADSGMGYQMGFSMDTDAPKIFAKNAVFKESAMDFMTPPNATQLTSLKSHGGKLIVYHGTADPVFSPNDTIAWYNAVNAADSQAPNYTRLYLVPGMNHCSGGPAAERFNMLPVLENWVEHGVAPGSVVAGVNPANPDVIAKAWPTSRTRPLCVYPQQAILKPGATDLESASSFVCQ